MKDTGDMQRRLRRAYGGAPEEYRREMGRACALLEEAPKMRRVSGLVVAFGLLVVLAGAALAAHRLGTFDFLFPGKEAPQEVQDRLQSGFVQQGGELETVSITVRDAVTDGISAFVAVEYQAKDPQDMLLSEFDPQGEKAPKDGRRRLVLWQDTAVGENLYLAGQDWKSLDEQTLLMHYVIDVGDRPASGGPLEIAFSPGVRVLGEKGRQEDLEQAQINISIQTGEMVQVQRKAPAPIRIQELGITLTQAEVTFTPLATYVSAAYQADASEEGLEGWMERYGNLWFKLRDGEGNTYGLLTGGRKYSDDAAWPYQERVEQMYERMEATPDHLALVPYLSGTGEEFEPIVLSLQ